MRATAPLFVATLLAAALAVPAQAQTKPAADAAATKAPAASSPAKKELINKIVALQLQQSEQFAAALAQQGPFGPMMNQAGQALQARVAQDKREATGKAMEEAARTYLREVQPGLRASLNKHMPLVIGAKLESSFNEAELREILRSIESPVLRRFAQIGQENQQALVQKAIQENQAQMQSKLQALDGKLADLLGLKPAAPAAAASK